MSKQQNMIPLQELNLTSRFLFEEVLEDPRTHQDILEIIFQKEIPLLEKNETEKELRVSPLLRSIRMDVFPWIRKRLFIIRKCSRKEGQIWRSAADTTSP